MNLSPVRLLTTLLFLCFCSFSTFAQTSALTYQGRLTDGASAASGTYEMQFKLFDAAEAGNQIGSTITNNSVAVNNGVFTVILDFGSSSFTGADRWLEAGVRKASDPPGFTTLTPRQPITSSPYSLKTLSAVSADSLSSACAGCVTDAKINSVSSTKVTGVVSVAIGGTGSSTQNFVDLSTDQPGIGGNKSFTGNLGIGGPDVPGQSLTVYNTSGNAALKTNPLGIRLGDVDANSFGNYLDIDFESLGRFKFFGGIVETTGNIQIPAANNYQYATPKTQYYSVPAAAFNLENSSVCDRAMIGGTIYTTGGSAATVAYFVAPVNLPSGATVTSVAFYVVDNDGTYNLQPGQLWRNDASTSTSYGNSVAMANVPIPASTNSTLIQLSSTTTISTPVIDNQNYTYFLRWGTQQNNANLRLAKVLITYTVTKVD